MIVGSADRAVSSGIASKKPANIIPVPTTFFPIKREVSVSWADFCFLRRSAFRSFDKDKEKFPLINGNTNVATTSHKRLETSTRLLIYDLSFLTN